MTGEELDNSNSFPFEIAVCLFFFEGDGLVFQGIDMSNHLIEKVFFPPGRLNAPHPGSLKNDASERKILSTMGMLGVRII